MVLGTPDATGRCWVWSILGNTGYCQGFAAPDASVCWKCATTHREIAYYNCLSQLRITIAYCNGVLQLRTVKQTFGQRRVFHVACRCGVLFLVSVDPTYQRPTYQRPLPLLPRICCARLLPAAEKPNSFQQHIIPARATKTPHKLPPVVCQMTTTPNCFLGVPVSLQSERFSRGARVVVVPHLTLRVFDTVSEWLRSWTRNPMGSAREGSNPFGVVFMSRFAQLSA